MKSCGTVRCSGGRHCLSCDTMLRFVVSVQGRHCVQLLLQIVGKECYGPGQKVQTERGTHQQPDGTRFKTSVSLASTASKGSTTAL